VKKIHWNRGVPVSWPSGGRRNPNMRTFLLAGYPVCGADHYTADTTAVREEVTCGSCKRRMAVARLDPPEVVDEVLARGTEYGSETKGDH